jgi:hypothetical protein
MFCFNENSLHGQFENVRHFTTAFGRVVRIRQTLSFYQIPLFISNRIRVRKVINERIFNDVIDDISADQKRQILTWIDKKGPFWEEQRTHKEDAYYTCGEEVVTDSGLAEIAQLKHEACSVDGTISISPSHWEYSPITVALKDSTNDFEEEIRNCWEIGQIEEYLKSTYGKIDSWDGMLACSKRECPNLLHSDKILDQLGKTFIPAVARSLLELLKVLNDLTQSILDCDTDKQQEIRRLWFSGEAHFSPSSHSELTSPKHKSNLTFYSPLSEKDVVCSMHGKTRRPHLLRIHYEWPIPQGRDKIFIAYIGPKLTKE